MLIPSLPTDNIYKMFFIAGLAIMLTSVVIYFNQFQKVQDKVDKFQEEVVISGNEIDLNNDILSNKLAEIESDTNADSARLNDPNKDSVKVKKEVILNAENRVIDLRKLAIGIIENKHIIIGEQKIKELKSKIIKRDLKFLNTLIIGFVIFMIIGLNLTWYGFKKWNNLIQKPNDEKIQLELQQLKRHIQKESENNQSL